MSVKTSTKVINDGARASDIDILKNEGAKDIANSDRAYDDRINGLETEKQGMLNQIEKNKANQEKIQNEQTDFAIKKIEQQKDQAHKDYLKEQRGAYSDYQKQIDPYGVNAEQMASMGMQNTGYSESSKVAMYNAYQNRVMVARESYDKAVLNYDNSIMEAKLQNSSLLAEIASQALAQSLEITLNFAARADTLFTQKMAAQREIRNEYITRWKTLLDQMNTEAARAEQKRQFNEEMAFKQAQFNYQKEKDAASLGGIVNTTKTSDSSSDNSSNESSSGGDVQTTKNQSSNSKNGLILGPTILGKTLKNFGLNSGLQLYMKNGKAGIKKS
jgi:hypothetical protein